jgi:hypothetical protein
MVDRLNESRVTSAAYQQPRGASLALAQVVGYRDLMRKLPVGLVLPLLLVAIGCDAGETIGPDPTGGAGGSTVEGGGFASGSRLRARTLVGADGSRQPAGWFDTQLETECTWRAAGDGQTRCIPVAVSTSLFADAECTTPVVHLPCSQTIPWHIEAPTFKCGSPPLGVSIFAVGQVIDAPSTVYTHGTSGQCVGAVVPPGGEWVSSGGLIDPSNFVAATVETE